jgi:hypothetical protein
MVVLIKVLLNGSLSAKILYRSAVEQVLFDDDSIPFG